MKDLGLVAGACFTDLNNDAWPDLVLATEWGPVRIFKNEHGKLVPWDAPVTLNHQSSTINQMTGWWSGVTSGDLDGDGRLDLVAGNWGLNSPYHASPEHPVRIYFGELSGTGAHDLLEAYDDPDLGIVPRRNFDAVSKALPFLREKFPTQMAYATASVAEILGEKMARVLELRANTLASMVFFNRGDHFEAVPLPPEAQWAPVFAVAVADMDGDAREDVFLSQNYFALQPEMPQLDAGRGLWLRGDGKGNLSAVAGQESGVRVYGEQRGAALCDYDQDGRVDLLVTQNAGATKLFHNVRAIPGLRVRLNGPPGNPNGIGAQLRLIFGQRLGPVREIRAGSGYWSQDSPVQVLATPESPTRIWVRWPGGQVTDSPVPQNAKEIAIPLEHP